MLHQSGGCCDGSSPMCLLEAELPPGPADVLIGEFEGTPFYIDADQDARWKHPEFLIDVAPGAATSLSLEGSAGVHFVARSPGPSDTAVEGIKLFTHANVVVDGGVQGISFNEASPFKV